ncbi:MULTISPECIES: DivIVA domain-containing protein [Polymorphospora]|uniref:DivIVA domain-containing protein n=1 Tax=Polymorphospora lycopeni TaxID=3140240 RepID=A0ABV5CZI7_9ACTN
MRTDDWSTAERPARMGHQQIRDAAFGPAPRRGGGLNPDEVRAFLHQVADQMLRLERELAEATSESIRVKEALYRWQVEHAATCAQRPR